MFCGGYRMLPSSRRRRLGEYLNRAVVVGCWGWNNKFKKMFLWWISDIT